MPYILNKTNGSIIATVQDAALDTTTDLTFLGKNYAGYGEVQNENFLKLLENFSNTSAPTKPIEGQLWFNSSSKKINVYDNTNWKGVANLEVASSDPVGTKNFTVGDLWFDSGSAQLYGYNGSNFVLVGPQTGDDVTANWRGSREFSTLEPNTPKYNIKAVIGDRNEVIAVVSHESYTIEPGTSSFPVWDGITGQEIIKKGITLVGSGTSGNSEAAGVYFWGSAAHSLRSNTSTYSTGIVATSNTNTNNAYAVPFINATTTGSTTYIDGTGLTYNPSTKTLATSIFDGVATSAYYADLAERYAADTEYEVGTVVVIGGSKEITVTHTHADISVAGIISQHPAYRMNSGAGTDETHPYVALRGRVPCKVIGHIKKGALLVTSSYPGYAEMMKSDDNPNAVIGKALQSFDGAKGIIEVLV
jgi:hypothetical protein